MAATFDPKRRALGKGLESLLPPARVVVPAAPVEAAPAQIQMVWGRPLEIALEMIDRNPMQTRTQFDPVKLGELAKSIAASGVVQPVVVKAMPEGRYQLIMGERRWLASFEAGKATIPAIVREVSDVQAMEMTIVENLQRADLNPIEQARAYARLARDFKMTQEEMAVRTGKDRASVTNFLRLLKLPKEIQDQVERGELTFGHARALLALEETERIEAATKKVIALSMSVRQAESYVAGLLNPEGRVAKEAAPEETMDPNVRDARDLLRQRLGLKVAIEDKHGRGRVIIEYSGLEDFDLILSALGGA
ncbi:ParB/RepB/Spo0J family partition protein [Granulicella arctica]|uniref:ParB family chromosome partitioning protein n=1 Tax=Granulicella arctica TaxID=940613 RepID=A0A7Y9PFC5_9BACT|nr:ParB/RepB/Spo0J family partition protein [Granulicella arctica]NYF78644.1 ParB family chromosome partitioning protein [Granulicella arctica]